ncbi:lipid A biosynthesis lauroyl acyltransferase [Bombiscardovia nodaiensis]|uniref:Lipid A biosynthesis lauroyl acyltransferase n=1 Tax=Bombiscardovia nodaiensis TaxID=2932181 RepID=A0ABM8B8J6_9BIFI|nr:lipid A biosynthesis lauroyl acyltransferase [Bombiscardovia nodaiensis]
MLSKLLTFVVGHAAGLSEPFLRSCCNIAADLAWCFHLGSLPQLERNLKHVLGQTSHAELRRLSRQSLRSYFAYFCEALTVSARSQEELMARIRTEGTGYPNPALEVVHNASMPIAMGHQGNWDYAGFWAGQALGPVTTVAERLADQELLDDFAHIRQELGMHILLTGQPHLVEQLTDVARQRGQVVPLLADRDLSRNGVFVRAFDSIIRVAAGPAVVALDSQLDLYTVNMHRERLQAERKAQAHSPYGYVCQIDGPIAIEPYLKMPRQQAVAALTQAWVDQWAYNIRSWPQDWHMMQPIFLEDLDLNRLHHVPDDIRARMEAQQGKVTHERQQ